MHWGLRYNPDFAYSSIQATSNFNLAAFVTGISKTTGGDFAIRTLITKSDENNGNFLSQKHLEFLTSFFHTILHIRFQSSSILQILS